MIVIQEIEQKDEVIDFETLFVVVVLETPPPFKKYATS